MVYNDWYYVHGVCEMVAMTGTIYMDYVKEYTMTGTIYMQGSPQLGGLGGTPNCTF